MFTCQTIESTYTITTLGYHWNYHYWHIFTLNWSSSILINSINFPTTKDKCPVYFQSRYILLVSNKLIVPLTICSRCLRTDPVTSYSILTLCTPFIIAVLNRIIFTLQWRCHQFSCCDERDSRWKKKEKLTD